MKQEYCYLTSKEVLQGPVAQIVQPLDFQSISSLLSTCSIFNRSKLRDIRKEKTRGNISSGLNHSFILLDNGRLFSWGDNEFGQLADGGINPQKTFNAVSLQCLNEPFTVNQVIAKNFNTVLQVNDNQFYACGNNECGQLGLGHTDNVLKFTAINPRLNKTASIRKIDMGVAHTLILSSDGKLYTSGSNTFLQLGHPSYIEDTTRFQKILLDEKSGIMDVIAGFNHSLILLENNQLLGCGFNKDGALGLGNMLFKQEQFTTIDIPDLAKGAPIHKVVASNHTLILAGNGELYGTGDNRDGQLGLGDMDCRYEFTRMELPFSVKPEDIFVGYEYSLVLSEGKLYGCGNNEHGQLGLGHTEPVTRFTLMDVPLKEGVKIQQISTLNYSIILLLDNGEMYGCGSNLEGELGLGDIDAVDRFVPILPTTINELLRIKEKQIDAKSAEEEGDGLTCKF